MAKYNKGTCLELGIEIPLFVTHMSVIDVFEYPGHSEHDQYRMGFLIGKNFYAINIPCKFVEKNARILSKEETVLFVGNLALAQLEKSK